MSEIKQRFADRIESKGGPNEDDTGAPAEELGEEEGQQAEQAGPEDEEG